MSLCHLQFIKYFLSKQTPSREIRLQKLSETVVMSIRAVYKTFSAMLEGTRRSGKAERAVEAKDFLQQI